MDASVIAELARRMEQISDPRRPNRLHPLVSIVSIAVLAVLSGANGWAAVARFAQEERRWLELFLPLPNGTPSRQTFERVFALLIPQEVEKCLRAWFQLMSVMSQGSGGTAGHLALDGKALRHSYRHAWDSSSMAYLVSAFASEQGLVLGQVETEGKGQELEGIRKLLELLDLKGRVVTIDALGCQKDIAATIRRKGGDYCLAVKDNQPRLHAKLAALLDEGLREKFAGWEADSHQETCGGHGRIETRTVHVTTEVQHLGQLRRQWADLAAVAVVQSRRRVLGQEPTVTRRYYILSRALSAPEVQRAVRGHWGVENGLHYILDVTCGEDASRIRKRSATHFSRLRRLAINLLKRETSVSDSVAGKRQRCAWSRDYRLKVLAASLPATGPTLTTK